MVHPIPCRGSGVVKSIEYEPVFPSVIPGLVRSRGSTYFIVFHPIPCRGFGSVKTRESECVMS